MNRQKQEQRKDSYKKTISNEDGRRKREEYTNEIRKTKQIEALQKRRQLGPSSSTSDSSSQDVGPAPTQIQQSFIDKVYSQNIVDQLDGVTNFRKLLSIEKNPPINAVIASGVVPRIVTFLYSSNNQKLRFESAWALTNIASGDSQQTEYIVNQNVVPIFIQLLSDQDEEIREQATWALGNIAGDSTKCRDFVLSLGVVAPILNIISHGSSKITVIRNATWTLSNLVRGKPSPRFDVVRPFIEVLARLINHHDQEVLVDALWALSYLSDGSELNIQAVIDAGVVSRIVSLLRSSVPQVQTPCLRTLGNIVTGTDLQTQHIIDAGAIPVFKTLLSSAKKNLRKEAAWALSNITAGNQAQTQLVINHEVIPSLIKLIGTNSDHDVRKEAAWALSNATTWKSFSQISYLIDHGIAPELSDLLTSEDNKLVTIALEAIESILATGASRKNGNNHFVPALEEAGIVERLEALQDHVNEDIYQKALNMLEKYFEVAEDACENIKPAVNTMTNTFSINNSQQPMTFSF